MNKVIINLGTSMKDVAEQHYNLPEKIQKLIFKGISVEEQTSLVDEMATHLDDPNFVTILTGAAQKKGIVIGAKVKASMPAGLNKRMTPEQKEQIKTMYLEKKTAKEIATALDTSTNTVHAHINKFKEAQAKAVAA